MKPPLVLTVTPNPSIDLLFEADRLVWDDANRLPEPRRRAGGQGINVLRAVAALGGQAAAIALLGGAAGDELAAMLAAERQHLIRVPAEGATRVFVAVRERATGRSLLLNPRGPHGTERSRAALLSAASSACRQLRPRWLAGCGSVPPGVPLDTYARLREVARSAGVRFVADCDGELLHHAVLAGCDLLVPNQHEAARLTGLPVADVAAAAAAASNLQARGVDTVCITMGPTGAVLASGGRCWHGIAPAQAAGSAVGAGDAFLAAALVAIEEGDTPPELLRRAVAAGTATLKSEGGDLLTLEEYRRQFARTEIRELTHD